MFDAAIADAAEAAPQAPIIVPTVPGLQLHVDGDYLGYYASGNEDTTEGEARMNALGLIEKFRGRVGAESIVMHMTANGCQKGERYLIATVKPYQAQRASGRKPKNQPFLQDWLMTYSGPAFRVKTWTTREADDGIAACAHYAIDNSKPGYVAIATADKDLRMLPGAHINWRTPSIVTRVHPGDYDVIGEDGKQYGLKFFFLQMLMGDTADHCPGLEHVRVDNPDGTLKSFAKCGEKTAAKLLESCTGRYQALQKLIYLYARAYPSSLSFAMDRLCEQAALLWMRLGNDAGVADFARHAGHSRLSSAFTPELWAAVERLETRVKLARTEINQFGNRHDPLCTDSLAG